MLDPRAARMNALLEAASVVERTLPDEPTLDQIEQTVEELEETVARVIEELRDAIAYARQDNLPRHLRPHDH